MLLHPTLAAREPVPGEEQGTHLEPCAFCATANGATALTCWRCGAHLQHGRLDELVSKRNANSVPAAAVAEAPPTATPPAGVPIPTLYPSFTAYDPNATVPMTVALGLLRQPSDATEEPVLDMAKLLGTAAAGGRQLADPRASAPEESKPGTDLVVAATPVPFTRKQRAMMAGGLLAISVLAVFAGSSLLDHYQTARVGSGWSASVRQEPVDTVAGKATDSKLGEDPAETLRRQPTQAGPAVIEAVSTATTAAPAAALVPLAAPASALATAVPTTPSTLGATASEGNPPALESGAAAALGPAAAGMANTTANNAANSNSNSTSNGTSNGAPSGTATTTAAATPVVASDTTVRRRNSGRSTAARYAAARRDAVEAREPAAARAEPATPRPCTAGVAALGLCTP